MNIKNGHFLDSYFQVSFHQMKGRIIQTSMFIASVRPSFRKYSQHLLFRSSDKV